ncbi:hypothetical protein RvY_11651 [Ramazzottius varieornatus]|uniref:Uncharacterized protein n=1 Tax=Ramazzottius varieornatus TaxID=947166 RepID=A0A1D1VGW2_RAMVA|nr:hypothetical protein RvY_11651 [Ramazzottius varieornatus]
MRNMKDELATMNLLPHDRALYWSAFTLAVFGAFRISGYTNPANRSFDSRTLLLTDVSTKPKGLNVRLRQSKIDQFSHGYTVQLLHTGRSVCIVRATTRYIHFRSSIGRTEDPLVILESDSYLTRPVRPSDVLYKPVFKAFLIQKFTPHTAYASLLPPLQLRTVPRRKPSSRSADGNPPASPAMSEPKCQVSAYNPTHLTTPPKISLTTLLNILAVCWFFGASHVAHTAEQACTSRVQYTFASYAEQASNVWVPTKGILVRESYALKVNVAELSE